MSSIVVQYKEQQCGRSCICFSRSNYWLSTSQKPRVFSSFLVIELLHILAKAITTNIHGSSNPDADCNQTSPLANFLVALRIEVCPCAPSDISIPNLTCTISYWYCVKAGHLLLHEEFQIQFPAQQFPEEINCK